MDRRMKAGSRVDMRMRKRYGNGCFHWLPVIPPDFHSSAAGHAVIAGTMEKILIQAWMAEVESASFCRFDTRPVTGGQ